MSGNDRYHLEGKKVLVTGGLGLIGSHIADLLLAKNCEVIILDNVQRQTHPHGVPPWRSEKAKLIVGDIRNADDWRKSIDGVDYIFHQAAFGGFTSALSEYMEANGVGTMKLFELVRDEPHNIKKIVVASSQAVYGEGLYACPTHGPKRPAVRVNPQYAAKQWEQLCDKCRQPLSSIPIAENEALRTDTPYGLSKLAQERTTLHWGQQLNIPVVALRYAVTYGPRQSIYNPYTGVISIFSTRLLNLMPPVVYEDGDQTRDFLFVEDCARANLFVMENEACDDRSLNVSTGHATSVKDLARALADVYNIQMEPLIEGEYRPQDVRHVILDPAAIETLGFKANVMLPEGLKKYASWIQEQGDIKEYFSEAQNDLKSAGVVKS